MVFRACGVTTKHGLTPEGDLPIVQLSGVLNPPLQRVLVAMSVSQCLRLSGTLCTSYSHPLNLAQLGTSIVAISLVVYCIAIVLYWTYACIVAFIYSSQEHVSVLRRLPKDANADGPKDNVITASTRKLALYEQATQVHHARLPFIHDLTNN